MKTDNIGERIQNLDIQLMNLLLLDQSTKRNIVWATTDYIDMGNYYAPECEITVNQIVSENNSIIKPRITKAKDRQNNRTRQKAEVFTPSWMCNAQNNLVDERWFGRPDVFNTTIGKRWKATKAKIVFPAKPKKTWQDYVRAKRLEITCGEAPYLVSRYDAVTGKQISAVHNRIGLLDRKLRVVDENTDNIDDWFAWTKKAYQSIYGYEYQGDNLLLARENLLLSFIDYMMNKWNREPTTIELKQIAYIISWNIWQMDGLKYTAPYSEVVSQDEYGQISLFDYDNAEKHETKAVSCIIRDWTNKCYVEFKSLFMNGGQ